MDVHHDIPAEMDLCFSVVGPGRTACGQVALLLPLVSELPADFDLEGLHGAITTGNTRNLKGRMQAKAATMDAGKFDLDDDSGRSWHVDIGVNEEQRGVTMGAAVEEKDWPLGLEWLLFGEFDFDFTGSEANERLGTNSLRVGC